MNTTPTPETDAASLKRDLDEARDMRDKISNELYLCTKSMIKAEAVIHDLIKERDEARSELRQICSTLKTTVDKFNLGSGGEKLDSLVCEALTNALQELQDWKDAAASAEHFHPDEIHCACVPLLKAKLAAEKALADRLANDLATCRTALLLPRLDSLESWKQARK